MRRNLLDDDDEIRKSVPARSWVGFLLLKVQRSSALYQQMLLGSLSNKFPDLEKYSECNGY